MELFGFKVNENLSAAIFTKGNNFSITLLEDKPHSKSKDFLTEEPLENERLFLGFLIFRHKAFFLYVAYAFLLWCLKDQLLKISGKREPQLHYHVTGASQIPGIETFHTNGAKPYCDLKEYLGRHETECKSILKHQTNTGDRKSLNKSRYDINIMNKAWQRTCDLENIFTNCEAVQQVLLYGKEDLSEEETSFPVAFAIKIHKNGNQAFRLLRLIYRKHNIYCIHVDKKAAIPLYEQFKSISNCVWNILVIEDRLNVVYSSIRQVEAELKCIDAVQKSPVKWKYYINLTGQEYMLRTNLEIVKILKLLNGSNDIESYTTEGFEHRYKTKFLIANNRIKKTGQNKQEFPGKIQMRKGSAYGMLSREFLEFITSDNFTWKFISWLKDTYAPEETIWATLNALPQAPGGYTREISHRNSSFLSRAMIWTMEPAICHGKYVHWVCIFGEKDLPWLVKQRQIVANKFYEGYGGLVLDCLEWHLYDRTIFPHLYKPLNLTLYESVPHILKES